MEIAQFIYGTHARAGSMAPLHRRERRMISPDGAAGTPPAEALASQLLGWIAERPRTYEEAMDAWRTSCPRLPVWEDAIDAGLIEVAAPPGVRTSDRPVRITERGQAFLRTAR